jgi:hypothetical protein
MALKSCSNSVTWISITSQSRGIGSPADGRCSIDTGVSLMMHTPTVTSWLEVGVLTMLFGFHHRAQ